MLLFMTVVFNKVNVQQQTNNSEELTTKIKSQHLNENAKRVAVAEQIVHLCRANKFYKKQQEVINLCCNDPEVGAIVFDFMQNLPLLKIPVHVLPAETFLVIHLLHS